MKPVKKLFRLSLFIVLLIPVQLKAQNTIVSGIKNQRAKLYYPNLVERFYRQNGYKLAWIAPDTVKTHAWDAMLLLDCIKQYGLNHEDYHPDILLYPTLHRLIETGSDKEKAKYDIMLTDAMIRFMNDLHYGKLNPFYTTAKIDKELLFKADAALLLALQSNDFLRSISRIQPNSKLYNDLQDHMRLLVGQRSGDCYVIPQGLIRKMAINMERLRWISTTGKQVHLTLIVREGEIVNYKDVYKQDEKLEMALYNENQEAKRDLKLNKLSPDRL
jgi:murein L,D-transpeptidase YcbB/YkuD